jgi:LDH2 family malate/lactate/ureidoglycolate dehydrogenase
MALDIAAFGPRETFDARIERMIAELKATPLAEGVQEILYPGELEARTEEQHRRDGLTLPEQTRLDLLREAATCGLAPPPGW